VLQLLKGSGTGLRGVEAGRRPPRVRPAACSTRPEGRVTLRHVQAGSAQRSCRPRGAQAGEERGVEIGCRVGSWPRTGKAARVRTDAAGVGRRRRVAQAGCRASGRTTRTTAPRRTKERKAIRSPNARVQSLAAVRGVARKTSEPRGGGRVRGVVCGEAWTSTAHVLARAAGRAVRGSAGPPGSRRRRRRPKSPGGRARARARRHGASDLRGGLPGQERGNEHTKEHTQNREPNPPRG
jgi:hypothetical protein